MQFQIGEMYLEIHKTWYNKTILQPDGRTYIVDTDTKYTAFQFGMAKKTIMI